MQYLNKLAKFTDTHTIEVVDKKGHTSPIISSCFVIATSVQMTIPLDCGGGEVAITSDIFALEMNP